MFHNKLFVFIEIMHGFNKFFTVENPDVLLRVVLDFFEFYFDQGHISDCVFDLLTHRRLSLFAFQDHLQNLVVLDFSVHFNLLMNLFNFFFDDILLLFYLCRLRLVSVKDIFPGLALVCCCFLPKKLQSLDRVGLLKNWRSNHLLELGGSESYTVIDFLI